jgi:pantothenate kinase-related protein Tda10
MSLIINFFGGPGIGKSTQASGLFTEMKKHHLDAELTFEYPKLIAWEENQSAIKDQFFVTANQHRNISRLYGKVDYIIVDSPIILGVIYKDRYGNKDEYPSSFYDDSFDVFILNLFKKYNSLNILLRRDDSTYNQNGRFQDLTESKLIDEEIKNRLDEHGIEYVEFEVNSTTPQEIFKYIVDFRSISMVY